MSALDDEPDRLLDNHPGDHAWLDEYRAGVSRPPESSGILPLGIGAALVAWQLQTRRTQLADTADRLSANTIGHPLPRSMAELPLRLGEKAKILRDRLVTLHRAVQDAAAGLRPPLLEIAMELDPDDLEVTYAGRRVQLTWQTLVFLRLLADSPQQSVAPNRILAGLRQADAIGGGRLHINDLLRRLRERFEGAGFQREQAHALFSYTGGEGVSLSIPAEQIHFV
jgi:hypothetical protein